MANAIPPVLIRFATGGLRDVDRAFASIEDRMSRFDRQATQGMVRESSARVRQAKSETQEREREAAKLTREQQKQENALKRETERGAKERERETKRETKEREREYARMFDEIARKEEEATRKHERETAKREAANKRLRQAVGRETTGALGRVFGGAGAVAGGIATIGGGFALADAARSQLSAERAAALLVNSATIGGQAAPGANVGNVLAQASVASREYGVDKTDLIGAVQNYVAKSSDFTGGLENMGFFAKLSKASGTKLEDITGAAGILRAQNKDLSAADMRQMLLDLTEQGKQGAVEISDLAHLAGGLGSTRGLYKGSETENQRKLLALAQLTRTEGMSAEDAATAVKDLGEEAVKKSVGKHAPQWLKDVTKGGTIDSQEKLIEAALLGTKGNQAQLLDVFNARGVKVFQRLAPIFNAAGGGEAGIEAVRQEMHPILAAHGSQEQLDQQFAQVMNQPAEKLATAFNRLKDVAATSLEPWLQKLADQVTKSVPDIEKFADRLSDLAEYLGNNPLGGIGTVLGIALTAEMTKAAIPTLMEKALTTRLGGELAIAAATLAVGVATINLLSEAEVHRQKDVVRTSNEDVNLASLLSSEAREGKVKPEDLAKAQAAAKAAQGEVDKRTPSEATDPMTGQVIGTDANDTQAAAERKNFELGLEALNAAIKKATDSIAKNGAQASNTSPSNPANSLPIDQRPSH